MPRVYVSSTYEDLKDHRAAVGDAIRRLGYTTFGLEEWAAAEDTPFEHILQDVATADLFVGIIAHRYGYIPNDPDNPEGLSITELEYEQAQRSRIRCLMFVVNREAPWPAAYIDGGAPAEKLRKFIDRIRAVNVVMPFTTATDLSSQVVAALTAKVPVPGRSPDGKDDAGQIAAAEPPPQPQVFLSYSSADAAHVLAIAERLHRDGIPIWVALTALQPGDDWRVVTRAAFNHSTVVVIFVGAAGFGAYQQEEVGGALDRVHSQPGFRVVPVLLPGADLERLPLGLRGYYWVDFRDSAESQEAYERLKSVLPRKAPATVDPAALAMLSDLLFRVVARLRDRPEMLRSLEPTAFWEAVHKIDPDARTIEDLTRLSRQLGDGPLPSPLWTSWIRHTRAVDLATLVRQPPSS